ncbi:FAD-dependent monooxygenase [Aureimonas sp. OT7]|uniref:FAD-dependent monooxygenase n=1 Tax=Aureimonas sp. OT7 TaxID=2816454 RepID=UPI00177EE91F|nr:FAD-dependent monooxygenase [Aureimonas sp. OT7]QOG06554.1 FAD-dependent monooxygenase [Aureimonas sp. OT7]
MAKRVLVTGGSVAANTLAWWLVKGGFDVTVVEKAPAFRDGGQNVDVRGVARGVLRRMGLEEEVGRSGTGETAWTFVDENSKVVGRFALKDLGANGPTAELEILRGELARLLYESVRDRAAYRFGDTVDSIEDGADAAYVRFQSGREEDYDLVLIAEGVGSSTRELVFEGENEPRWMDVTMGYFTIPKGPGDGSDARWYNAPDGRSVFLRPDNKGTTRAVLTLQALVREAPAAPEEQKQWLKERFSDSGWETPRVLDGLEDANDLYFDLLRQVKMKRWRKGRVAVTGDAAWCATPLSGIGTTLAIVGAYVLAGELSKGDDIERAFKCYEDIMRPFVKKGQNVPKIGPRLMQPHSRLGVSLQRSVLGIASKPGIQKVLTKVAMPRAESVELPEYPFDA